MINKLRISQEPLRKGYSEYKMLPVFLSVVRLYISIPHERNLEEFIWPLGLSY